MISDKWLVTSDERVAPRNLLICGVILFLFCSCERRPLIEREESLNYAEVSVEFDWSLSGMSPTGMTAIFYPADGSSPTIHKTGDVVSTVRLREGTYHVVGFNYSFDEFDGLLFRGTERYETIEAYAAPLPDVTSREGATVTNVREHPDILAVDRLESFEVTPDMIRQTTELARSRQSQARSTTMLPTGSDTRSAAYIRLTPVRVVAPGYVKVHLKGLNYIRSAHGVVTGLSGSYFLGLGSASSVGCSLVFDFASPTYYAGSRFNGSVEGSFTTFGLLPGDVGTRAGGQYGFLFRAVLIDKDRTSFEQAFDVTTLLRQEMDVNLNILLRLDLELGMSATPEDDTPTIVVPEVQPEDGGAFDVNVGDWGEEENVYL